MNLPFTTKQFFDIFQTYNTTIWPAQVLSYLLGILALALAFKASLIRERIISGILAAFWLWNGLIYQMVFFAQINPVAEFFGIFFIIEGVLLLGYGLFSRRLSFGFSFKPGALTGLILIVYALVLYPLLGIWLGEHYPRLPLFGVAPCPTTIFTFGLLLWARKAVPVPLLIIPFLWSLLGMSAALQLGIIPDYGLVLAGILGTVLILVANKKINQNSVNISV